MRFLLTLAVCAPFLVRAAGIHTLAGTGEAGYSGQKINNPYGMRIGPDGALYVCEIGSHVIRRIDLKTGAMSTFAGTGEKGNSGDGGAATKAQLNEPYEVVFDRAGNLFFTDMQVHSIRRIDGRPASSPPSRAPVSRASAVMADPRHRRSSASHIALPLHPMAAC